jgi:hypothetical protein
MESSDGLRTISQMQSKQDETTSSWHWICCMINDDFKHLHFLFIFFLHFLWTLSWNRDNVLKTNNHIQPNAKNALEAEIDKANITLIKHEISTSSWNLFPTNRNQFEALKTWTMEFEMKTWAFRLGDTK